MKMLSVLLVEGMILVIPGPLRLWLAHPLRPDGRLNHLRLLAIVGIAQQIARTCQISRIYGIKVMRIIRMDHQLEQGL